METRRHKVVLYVSYLESGHAKNLAQKNVVLGMVSFLTNFYANVSSESNLSKNKQTNFGYYNLRSKLLLTCCVQDVHGPS